MPSLGAAKCTGFCIRPCGTCRRCPRGRQPPATDEVGRCLPRHCPRSRAETGRCPRSKQLCVCRANDLSPRDEEAQQQTCLRNLPSDSGAGGAKVRISCWSLAHCRRARLGCPRSLRARARAMPHIPHPLVAREAWPLRVPSTASCAGVQVQATSPLSRPLRLSSLAADELGPR